MITEEVSASTCPSVNIPVSADRSGFKAGTGRELCHVLVQYHTVIIVITVLGSVLVPFKCELSRM